MAHPAGSLSTCAPTWLSPGSVRLPPAGALPPPQFSFRVSGRSGPCSPPQRRRGAAVFPSQMLPKRVVCIQCRKGPGKAHDVSIYRGLKSIPFHSEKGHAFLFHLPTPRQGPILSLSALLPSTLANRISKAVLGQWSSRQSLTSREWHRQCGTELRRFRKAVCLAYHFNAMVWSSWESDEVNLVVFLNDSP